MSFTTESNGYEKTILLDLQGAWTLLRESVVDTADLTEWTVCFFILTRQ